MLSRYVGGGVDEQGADCAQVLAGERDGSGLSELPCGRARVVIRGASASRDVQFILPD
jgi:hypothetical protein